MKIRLELDPDFHAETAESATFLVYGPETAVNWLGTVAIRFTEGPHNDQHKIEVELPGMPHYQQAKIIYEASMMLDTHFAPDGRDPQVKAEFDA
jgi:hypothetical protein